MFAAKAGVTPSNTYVDDVFSTYLYTGNGSTQTINNGIDLAGKGGLVWLKPRTGTYNNTVVDTARGVGAYMYTNATTAQNINTSYTVTAFNSNGFTLGLDNNGENASGVTSVSWTFRKQPKFFDVVTWTGDGNAGRSPIAHSLGCAPGLILLKPTSATGDWYVVHRGSNGTTDIKFGNGLNLTNALNTTGSDYSAYFNASTFSPNVWGSNVNGVQYVAYLFAHDTATDGIIQCGSFTTSSGVSGLVNIGWEPQFVMIKRTDSSTLGDWQIYDTMRGAIASNNAGTFAQSSQKLLPNSSAAEATDSYGLGVYQQGFNFNNGSGTSTYIYIAIRRGPMRVPTSGASVYNALTNTGNGAAVRSYTGVGFPPDTVIPIMRTSPGNHMWGDRLRGSPKLDSTSTAAESSGFVQSYDQDGWTTASDAFGNNNTYTFVDYAFRRAPGFFDVVCYTGTGSAQTISHNLGVAPELVIVKSRNDPTGWTFAWGVYVSSMTTPSNQILALNNPYPTNFGVSVLTGTPSSTAFTLSTSSEYNGSGFTYVAYLFATLPGISKVGTYTGNGSSQTINCGFTTGARFVLIKRTDSTGDWYVWDTVRGIVSANDPHLSLNTTAAEVTTDDSIDPDSTGFSVNQVAATNVNVSGGTYIYLAIA